MRKILPVIVLITGAYLSSFSQMRNSLQTEPFHRLPSNRNMERFRLGDTSLRGHLNNPFNDNNFSFPDFSIKDRSFHQNQKGRLNSSGSFDHMPCIKPQGYFYMPVYKPDSTIRFSLLIKKYEKDGMGKYK